MPSYALKKKQEVNAILASCFASTTCDAVALIITARVSQVLLHLSDLSDLVFESVLVESFLELSVGWIVSDCNSAVSEKGLLLFDEVPEMAKPPTKAAAIIAIITFFMFFIFCLIDVITSI